MGKITKTMQAKHKETLSPWLKDYVDSACTTPLPLLPDRLAEFPSRWPFGRGDLYHWIPLLNRFDAILELFCKIYELNKGPQPRDFGSELLLEHSGDSQLGGEPDWREKLPADFHIHPEGDRLLIEALLRFTNMLLEHCGNRSIYASSGHLDDLLNTTSWSVLIAALEVSSELAQRYQASVRRLGNASRQISSALLANHYNIDLGKVQQLAAPFVKTSIFSLGDTASLSTPASSSKGKEKTQAGTSKNSNVLHANDLVSLALADDTRWAGWGDLRMTYYPEETVSEEKPRAEPGRSSQPSTPTPLRRSHTVGSHNQTTPRSRQAHGDDSSPLAPRTPGAADDHTASSDQKTFELPQSVVTATPIRELVSGLPQDMPSSSRYEAFNRMRIAQALAGSRQDRQNALAVRLLAITNLAYIYGESSFIEKVMRHDADETRRFQLVYQLVELIRPPTDGAVGAPLWLQTISLTLLEAVAAFNAKSQDVISALNANVNHGVLLYVIRKAVASIKEDSQSEDLAKVTEEDEWRDSLFSLSLYLALQTRAGSELVSAGLMEILVDMLRLRSKIAQRHHSMVVGFLDGAIWSYQSAFTALFNSDGLDVMADLVVDTVKEARRLVEDGRGTTPELQSSSVDYQIPYYQQQTLRWLLRFIHHVMSNSYTYGANTDRVLRNLVDKSDLLASLTEVIADKRMFGSVDWTNSVTILSDFINNDPTSFVVIMESGMIKTFLEAITGRDVPTDSVEPPKEDEEGDAPDSPASSAIMADIEDDDRPHPPTEAMLEQTARRPKAAGILPSSEAINIVPSVLNSICLNSSGMKLVASSRAFDSFLEIFESPDHVKCMEIDSDLASNVGSSFDELARHHPALRTSISNAVLDMVARVRYFGIDKSLTPGWGVRLMVTNEAGELQSVTPEGGFENVTGTKDSIDAAAEDTGDVDMTGEPASPNEGGRKPSSGDNKDSPENSFTPYVFAVSSFLTAYLSNNVLRGSFVERGGMEMLLDICESPSLAANFGDSLASRVLGQVIATTVDFSPVRGLPSLLNRTQAAIDATAPIASKVNPIPPYFAPFLAPDTSMQNADEDASQVIRSGTKIIKAFLNAQTLIKIVSECFVSSRSNSLTFHPINVYDHFLRLINSIGPLLRGVLSEEAGQLTMIPSHWSGRRSPSLNDAQPGEMDDGSEENNTIQDAIGQSVLGGEAAGDGAEAPKMTQLSAQEQASARFQNHEIFRNLLHPMIPTTFPLFQSVGKALLPRREPTHQGDLYPRPRQIELAKALANVVLDYLQPSVAVPKPTSKDFHYWIIMLHTIHEMLIENPHPRHVDRSSSQLIMPVLLAFKEQDGLVVLRTMLETFRRCVQQGEDGAANEPSKPKIAAFGLKKILDLFFILVNGKYITDASGNSNLQRHTDRASTVTNIYPQLVVEMRAIILPSVTDLWKSPVVEKIPDQTAKRLIDVLKLIASADHEAPSTPKDKKPFLLLNYNDVRFNWDSARLAVDQLVDEFGEDLAHEAVFRSNGSVSAARDYCRAHRLGIAGPRNPIPPADADTSSGTESRGPRPARASSDVTSSSDADRMSLDESEPLPGETFRDLVDRFAQAAGEGPNQAANSTDEDPSTSADATQSQSQPGFVATRADLDQLRADLRVDLIDRCLDIIRTHPSTAMEVSDLINAMVIKQQNLDMQEDVCSTLTFAISSLALQDEDKKRNGKCIASYAHLLALLLQDEGFFRQNLDNLREKVEEYIDFVKVPYPTGSDELPPWIPYILLVLELLLRQDERPIAAEWRAPKSLDEPVTEPVLTLPTPLINSEHRGRLLDCVLELLPRIGKEDVLATSVLRVIVILTRNRGLAKRVGDKKNMQRLFLMAKQLAGSGSDRLKQSRMPPLIITILRHIIEDEDVLGQIMRSEIKSEFPNISRGSRSQPDLTAYLRHMAPLALRSPDFFVKATNEMIEIQKWSPAAGDQVRSPQVTLKRTESVQEDGSAQKETAPANPEVKPSTEPADQDMTDASKGQPDTKRPLVENPDGVVHFLLSELINYREVEDKEPAAPATNAESTTQDQADPASIESAEEGEADKKAAKPVFKSEEHPIFVYRCFLLNCLTELLHSYNRTKVEFINFKRTTQPLLSNTPVKPRSSVLNYLIYDLLCQGNLSGTNDTIQAKKKAATSSHTRKVLVALVSRTKEKPLDRSMPKLAYDDDPDLQFVRKFVLDTILKAYERAPTSDDPLETRYSRMQCLAELMTHMIGERDRDHGSHTRSSDNVLSRSQTQLRRLMYEKGFLDKLTSSIAEINLNFPGVKRAIKYILRVLRMLTDVAKELSHSNLLPSAPADTVDDDIGSTSSLSELEDEREETPDLYRNSSLGMLEPRGEDESEEEDEEVDDMYGDEYDDEMDYEDEELSGDDQDNVSEDSEMGEVEGLPGEPGVVEVVMDGDEDDEDEDSEDDDDDDDEDSDDDDLDSDDMDYGDDRLEIIDEDGDVLDDDGNSDWENESDAHEEEEEDLEDGDIDYEAEAEAVDGHIPGMPPPGGLLGNMARALIEGDEYDPDLMEGHYPEEDLDDEDDDAEEDMAEEEEYLMDEEAEDPLYDQPPSIPGLGWDGLNADNDRARLAIFEHTHHRRRGTMGMNDRSPFPPGLIVGGAHGDPLGDFRSYFSRHSRASGPQPAAEDGINPLLRREDQSRDAQPRPGHPPSLGLRIPDSLFTGAGRRGIDGPMGFLGELMDILPVMGREGQTFHLQIGRHDGLHDARDMLPRGASRNDHRREVGSQEPSHAVYFTVQSTMDRFDEEAKMLFGGSAAGEALKLAFIIHAKLTPAAMERERKFLEEEAEKKRLAELARKAEEEERKIKLEKERQEREAREREEAEAREAAARAAELETNNAESTSQANHGEMEGIESSTQGDTDQTGNASARAADSRPRVMATIGDQEIDVTDLGIDPEYLDALPEEFREEVVAQAVSARRSQAREEASTGETPAAFQEFLEALPPQLRREIEQQEAQERRRRDHTSARAAVSTGGQDVIQSDMDTASILLTFPPELREQVLLEQGDEIMDQLPPDMAAQARRLQGDAGAPRPIMGRGPPGPGRSGLQPQQQASGESKIQRRAVVQMLDKAGVATLVRLMFVAQHGSIRNYLFSVFADVCENRLNRLEVISTILQILQEGSIDMVAVDRSFTQLTLKARRAKEKERDGDQKTPQGLKRTLTGFNAASLTQTNSETSPLLIVQQCLDLLVDLCAKNVHVPWLFLTEHDAVAANLKRTLSRRSKAKDKDTKAFKFAINSLLTLLDRDLIMESSVVMTHLADLLNRVTLPLQALERRRKEAEEKKKSETNEGKEPPTEEQPGSSQPAEAADNQAETQNNTDQGTKKDDAEAAQKSDRHLQPPYIPAQNLKLVVRIFVARECSSKTFQNTISTIKNLSTVPGAKAVFGQELVNQARLLSKNIVTDLEDLLPHIEKASSGTEIQGVALAKFSPGASEQNKLLRVLTALDHLFDGKKKQQGASEAEGEKQDLLSSLYHNSTFSAMWDKLSSCLTAIHERENMLNVATILLPLIESLMVVCKNTTAVDEHQPMGRPEKDLVLSSPPPESNAANLFFTFTEDHRRILNELVRHNPKLMSGTFALLVKNPKVLEFDNKRNYFNRSVHSRTGQPQHGRPSFPSLNLSVRRDQVFHDSFRSLYFKSGDEMKFGKLNIRFHGEEGVDAGGVTREWFQVLARQMFDPNYALFIPVSSDRTTFHPNKLSGINDEHLMFFKFIGRIIGKALYEGRLLDCFFSRAVYKRILGKSVSVKDMESFDPDYYKSLCWMLENDITDIITETFSVEDDEFGVTKVVDLIPDGRNIAVTDENKHDYVRLVVEHKLLASVKEQMENFLKGFNDIIPAELISIFTEQELELLISGLPDISIDDWKSNSEYHNYTPSSAQIQWFWRAVRSFDKEERAKLLQFVTGTSKVPLNGFKELEGMNGISRFNIHRDYSSTDRLPTSHTCFNQLDLPEYESYDVLRSQILKAITQGSEYFGFA